MNPDLLIINLFRRKFREWSRNSGAMLTDADMDEIAATIREWKAALEAAGLASASPGPLKPVKSLSGAEISPERQK
jgi:hypothetical protein